MTHLCTCPCSFVAWFPLVISSASSFLVISNRFPFLCHFNRFPFLSFRTAAAVRDPPLLLQISRSRALTCVRARSLEMTGGSEARILIISLRETIRAPAHFSSRRAPFLVISSAPSFLVSFISNHFPFPCHFEPRSGEKSCFPHSDFSVARPHFRSGRVPRNDRIRYSKCDKQRDQLHPSLILA